MSPETCEQLRVRQEFTELELDQLNTEFASLEPQERIGRAFELFGDCLVLSTTFGPTAPLMLQLANESIPGIRVINIRHGHETKKTRELAEWYTNELDLDVQVYETERLVIPKQDTLVFLEFQNKIKIEPFQNMIDELRPQACLFGVMRWQTLERADMDFVEKRGSIIAINPILDVTEKEVEDFFEQTGLPINTDYFDPAKASLGTECRLNTSNFQ